MTETYGLYHGDTLLKAHSTVRACWVEALERGVVMENSRVRFLLSGYSIKEILE